MRTPLRVLLTSALAFVIACGSDSKNPTAPNGSLTVTELRVGVAGNGPPVIEPGRTAQLFAQAAMSDGTVQDVTNSATWQSSNPQVATVSPTGLVSAHVNGDVTITATYFKTGNVGLQVRKDCIYTLSPPTLNSDPFGRTVPVGVASSSSTCTWTATSGASWVRIVGSGSGVGTGSFEYELAGNNTTAERSAEVTVAGEGGTATHRVIQARPSCSYVIDPAEVFVSLGGGSGSFKVNATPNDCQWTAQSSGNLYATNASSWAPTEGDYTVKYTAYSDDAGSVGTISICGLSGRTPCGIFTVRWRN
jgi:hypothetical protein